MSTELARRTFYSSTDLSGLTNPYGFNVLVRVDIGDHNAPAVGDIVMPMNTAAVLGPWLVVIGLVGCIGTIVVVAKKR